MSKKVQEEGAVAVKEADEEKDHEDASISDAALDDVLGHDDFAIPVDGEDDEVVEEEPDAVTHDEGDAWSDI